ncbi:MAG TPA: TlpA disulfide reductase family protein, partial [Candidatus Omnitrophota bacterium]|nr:TlpA disulfide reductase family protein [Candidatus Omnitrophota bacterium]
PLLSEPAQTLTLSEAYRQSPVLLVFWATWCPPCVEEIPILNDWVEQYGRSGLQIIAVNVEESFERLVDFEKINPMAYPVLMDTEGALAPKYGLVGLPVSVYIVKGGEILYYGFGLPSHIEALMSKGSVAQ